MKKILSIILSVCLLVTISGSAVLAHDVTNEYESMEIRKESVLKTHKDKIRAIETNVVTKTYAGNEKSNFDLKLEVQAETVRELREIGYDAYDVNPQTFESIESKLNTDLTEAGLREDGAYIITLDEEIYANPRAVIDGPHSHTYNGTTYTIRFMTIRPTDDPVLKKTSEVDLVARNSATQIILNAIDTGIYSAMSALSGTTALLGTIGSILGVSVSNINPVGDTTFSLVAATEWTQRFTQVWDNTNQVWVFGSCVENVELESEFSGYYYDNNIHDFVSRHEVHPERVLASSHFDDFNWRKNYAVIGYLNSWIQWDITGDATYTFGGRTVITHRHNF